MGRELLMGERGEPALDQVVAPLAHVGDDVSPEQIPGEDGVVRAHRMGNGSVGVSLCLIPRARTKVQRSRQIRLALAQLEAEGVPEQAVPAVASVSRVKRAQQHAAPLQLGERAARSLAVENGVAQRAGQLVQHRCPDRELHQAGRQTGQDLIVEVLREPVIVSAEVGHGFANLRLVTHRERGQVQRRGPALRPPDERLHRA